MTISSVNMLVTTCDSYKMRMRMPTNAISHSTSNSESVQIMQVLFIIYTGIILKCFLTQTIFVLSLV